VLELDPCKSLSRRVLDDICDSNSPAYGIHLTSEKEPHTSNETMRWKRGNRLRLVDEEDAPPQTREIFREVRHSLGLPSIPVLYKAYAAFPQFLELHWQAFRPAIQSRQFFILGARMAAESYTRAHNYFEIDSLTMCETSSDSLLRLPVSQVLDYYQYLDPLLLLIAAAQVQAFEGGVGKGSSPESSNHPDFPVPPGLQSEEQVSPAVHRAWDERRRLLEAPFVPDEHRALACWPELYREYWSGLKVILQSPVYADCQYRLGDSALSLAGELPVQVETSVAQLLEAGICGDELSSLVRINQAFMQAMTGLLLDVTFARIGCDGGTHRQSPETKEREHTRKRKKARSPIRAA